MALHAILLSALLEAMLLPLLMDILQQACISSLSQCRNEDDRPPALPLGMNGIADDDIRAPLPGTGPPLLES